MKRLFIILAGVVAGIAAYTMDMYGRIPSLPMCAPGLCRGIGGSNRCVGQQGRFQGRGRSGPDDHCRPFRIRQISLRDPA